ncbi:Rne/Rng family ribonuclease [Chloracidobacterium sp. MS 40/45]|uniref:Rne/Rng family ribonuclease n=1 Tax=Chloracidobacterium aggregatum TaxID=2851959 RepID=UPI001B8B6854|nr:Rne/Rng family ribonuclease [Chloracidobacterium aggregatum]QUV99319.1 Rne/Rng family ribonuclease [Chloracidobacterium sp. MS 40/45]
MNKEMIISVNAYEKRVAILENGVVVEFYVERADESKAVVGNIYKGKVRKVLPGMQSAFVDIGLERDAFLYVGDFFEETEEDLDTTESLPRLPVERSERPERQPEPVRREPEGRRGGRDRRPEFPAGRPAVTGTPDEAAAVDLKPEETTVSPRLPEAPGEGGPSAEDAVGDVRVDTPLLSSLLESAAGARFERVSDDLEEARMAQEAAPTRSELSETLVVDEAVARDDSLEIEREALAESTEPGTPRERRRGRRKEVIGEEKKKTSRRRGRKVEDEVAALMTSETPAATPSALEAQFERVRDEDYEEAAGDLLKDALIQQKIIAQTRIEELATRPEEPAPEPVEANEAPPMEPLTLGYERIADEDEPLSTVAEPPTADAGPTTDDAPLSAAADAVTAGAAPAETVPAETGAADVDEASPQGEAEAGEARADEEQADEEKAQGDTAQLQVRPSQAEFPPRRGRRSRRRSGARTTAAPGDESAESDDRSDSPEEAAEPGATPEAEVSYRSDANRLPENGNVAVAPEEPAVVVREIPVSAESLSLIEAQSAVEPRTEFRAGREARPAARPARDDRRDEPRKDDRKDDRRDLDLPRRQPAITELLREGQEIIVQIAKEPIGLKGARITSYVSLPGRYLVYLPTISHIGVSRKISTEQERARLKRTLTMLREREGITGGFIVRTACEGRSEQDLCDDMLYLARTWRDIRRRAEQARAGTVLCRELDLVQRLLRDHMSSDFSVIRVDDPGEYTNIVDFINRFQPKLVDRVRLYTRNRPIFEEYNIQPEIEAALKPRVWLKSGGFIVINQTEALVAIDVNTGKFVGKSNRLEDTITRTNLEAAAEIVRQIRLRDLGGIIVLDFIDMEDRRNRQKVMQVLEQAMKSDRSPSKITAFNDFGLVAITRKRVRQSLERMLSEPCHYCGGSGMIKSAQTMCYEILSDAKHLAKEKAASSQVFSEVTLRVSPPVADLLRGAESRVLREIEFNFGTPVTLHSDPNIHQERFDFAFM